MDEKTPLIVPQNGSVSKEGALASDPYSSLSPPSDPVQIEAAFQSSNFPREQEMTHPVVFNSDKPVAGEVFQQVIQDVKAAIAAGVQPIRISQGSSGSYFCMNTAHRKVGVFKPKNEEPYGKLNPKWTKWLHRTFLPCFFGRGCLIPNLGYISEAAASVVDRLLNLNIVPRTEVVDLASPSFYYTARTRAKASKKGQLPPKIGSFQVFMDGYKDAYLYFREFQENPLSDNLKHQFRSQFERLVILDYIIRNTDRGNDNWLIKIDYAPEEPSPKIHVNGAPKSLSKAQRKAARTKAKGKAKALADDPDPATAFHPVAAATSTFGISRQSGSLTSTDDDLAVSQAEAQADTTAAVQPTEPTPQATNDNEDAGGSSSSDDEQERVVAEPTEPASKAEDEEWEKVHSPRLFIAAIDNGLSFPYKHPDNWRTYPFGWSFLPAAQVPFSEETCAEFLPQLIDPEFVDHLVLELRKVMELDKDFNERVFQQQMSVLRGQVYNLTEALMRRKTPMQLAQMQAITISHEKMRSGINRRFIAFRRRAPCFSGC